MQTVLRESWISSLSVEVQVRRRIVLLKAIERTFAELSKQSAKLSTGLHYGSKADLIIKAQDRRNTSALLSVEWDNDTVEEKKKNVFLFISDDFDGEDDDDLSEADAKSIHIKITDSQSFDQAMQHLSMFVESHFSIPTDKFYKSLSQAIKTERKTRKAQKSTAKQAAKLGF